MVFGFSRRGKVDGMDEGVIVWVGHFSLRAVSGQRSEVGVEFGPSQRAVPLDLLRLSHVLGQCVPLDHDITPSLPSVPPKFR